MSKPDHEALVEAAVARMRELRDRNYVDVAIARAVLALVLAKLETVTPEMADAYWTSPVVEEAWRAMLAASPLSPGRAEDKSTEAGK